MASLHDGASGKFTWQRARAFAIGATWCVYAATVRAGDAPVNKPSAPPSGNATAQTPANTPPTTPPANPVAANSTGALSGNVSATPPPPPPAPAPAGNTAISANTTVASPTATPPPDTAGPHTFAPTGGKPFPGVIVNVVDDTLYVKRSDGQLVRIPTSTFSANDQKFIRAWMVHEASTNRDGMFRASAARVRSEPVASVQQNTGTTSSTWQEGYAVKLDNINSFQWSNLTVRYIAFVARTNSGQPVSSDTIVSNITGSVSLDTVKSDDEAKFTTQKASLARTTVNAGPYYTNTGTYYYNTQAKDTVDALCALWLRVYDTDGMMIYEWSSAPDITKDQSWDAIWNPRGRGRRSSYQNSDRTPPERGN